MCDGLIEGFIGLQLGLIQLYPNKIADRTKTRIISKSSPCLSDVAVYISGGRQQYNTFYVDNNIQGLYIVQRIDTKNTIVIQREANIKPAIIDQMSDDAIAGKLNECQLEKLKKLETDYSNFLLRINPNNLFTVEYVDNSEWIPKADIYIKTDIINKNKTRCNKN